MRRFSARVGWAVLGFGLVILWHAGEPFVLPPSALETQTLQAAQDCEVLFVGSSFVKLQVFPSVFDRAAERLGSPLRSCSYGQVGLFGHELRYRLERLLAHDWPRLRLVVLDVAREDIPKPVFNWFKDRTVEFHTISVVPWAVRRYRNDPRGWIKKLPDLHVTFLHVALHYAQVGRGLRRLNDLARALRIPSTRAPDPSLPPKFSAEATKTPNARRAVKRLVRERRKLERRRVRSSSAWLLEMREVIRAAGHEAVFMFPPALRPRPMPARALEGEDRLVVLDYLDPERYPALYRQSSRGFTSHLSNKGSVIWSQMLARDLLPLAAKPH